MTGAGASGPAVAVVGSLNWDVTYRVAQLPAPGETTAAYARFTGPGGKGANQALAAARLGSATTMVGCVGGDEPGAALCGALRDAGVDTRHLARVEEPSGGAVVLLDDDGENSIVVHAGANALLTAERVAVAREPLAAAAVVLLGFEVPQEAALAAAEASGGTVVLNPAPAPPESLPPELLRRVDVLVPNRVELASLAGVAVPASLEEVAHAAARVDARALVVTLGAEGALVCERGAAPLHVPAPRADVRDTTGAGDVFCGALADGLARALGLEPAVRRAVAAAALATEQLGAAVPESLSARLAARFPG